MILKMLFMVTSERVSNHTVDDVSKFTRISTDLRVYELNYCSGLGLELAQSISCST
jgi:hypothetical protein